MYLEPWDESHMPRKFERTDPTGRFSPIIEPELPDTFWLAVIGGIVLGLGLALLIYIWVGY